MAKPDLNPNFLVFLIAAWYHPKYQLYAVFSASNHKETWEIKFTENPLYTCISLLILFPISWDKYNEEREAQELRQFAQDHRAMK